MGAKTPCVHGRVTPALCDAARDVFVVCVDDTDTDDDSENVAVPEERSETNARTRVCRPASDVLDAERDRERDGVRDWGEQRHWIGTVQDVFE